MTASIRDIAQRAGVATSTVSRVINGSERYRISEKTAKRVWKAVEELNYRVDPIARHNIRRRWHDDKPRAGKYRFAVVYPGLRNELASLFYYDILFGIQEAILSAKMALAGVYEQRWLEDQAAFFQATDPMDVDGLLMVNTGPATLRKRLRRRIAAGVMLNDVGGRGEDSIAFDYREAIHTMVRHMASLGHRHIAYAGRPLVTGPSYATLERTRGYLEAMEELGLPVPEGYVIDTAGAAIKGFQTQWEQFKSLRPRPTALVCASDRVCIEMMRRLVQGGLRVPEDVAIGGYEDLDVASFMIPRLTTIHVPRREMGAQAVRLLTRRVEHPEAPAEHVVLKTHLVVRESCGASNA